MKMQAEVCIFIKLRLQHRCCFPVKFVKFLKTPILKNICERLFYIMMFLMFMLLHHEYDDVAETMETNFHFRQSSYV